MFSMEWGVLRRLNRIILGYIVYKGAFAMIQR
jgi:hypothetical protein